MQALSQAAVLPSVPGLCSGISTCTVVPAGAVTSLCPSGSIFTLPGRLGLHSGWHTGHRHPHWSPQSPTVPAIPEERR